jgi:hypothetical protein
MIVEEMGNYDRIIFRHLLISDVDQSKNKKQWFLFHHILFL